MANPSKQKGTAWETAVVALLNEGGIPCERRALKGKLDEGDVAGIPGWVLELKNHRDLHLAGWLKELAAEQRNAGTLFGAVVIKQRGKAPDQAYVLTSMDVLLELLPRSAK